MVQSVAACVAASLRHLAAALVTALITVLVVTQATAASLTTLSGTVTLEGKPAAGATVTAAGNNLSLKTSTDENGRFSFAGTAIGSYTVSAVKGADAASQTVDVSSGGVSVTLELRLKTIGNVSVARPAPVRGSGTDIALNSNMLRKTPGSGSLPSLLLQVPGAARGANGVVHINGDHGDINYIVDGVAIPQALNRPIGTEYDSNDISYAEILQGAYPAQYGERFASVVNINTLTGTGPAGFTGSVNAGSFATADSSLTFHTPAGAGSLIAALHAFRTNRGLDPPDFDSPQNNASNTNQFLRFTMPTKNNSYYNLTFSNSYQTFQIPNFVSAGQPATSNVNETQADTFLSASYRHSIGSIGGFNAGFTWKQSHIRDFPDPVNDWIFGINTNLLNGGTLTDCRNAFALQSVNQCGFSLLSDRTASDYGFNAEYFIQSGRHTLRTGGFYSSTIVPKLYVIALQPLNYLAPIYTPATPDRPYAVVDNAPNVGHTQAVFVQDTWRWNPQWQLDYGLRFTGFQVFSTQFDQGFSQFSPRIRLTRNLGANASVYAYFGRFFTPFSLENVSPEASFILNQPLQTSVAPFDLRPQRDSVFEFGGHTAFAGGEVGVRLMSKDATDLIDDTQVGFTNLHQDINYALGRISTQSLYYQRPLPLRGRAYLALTHTYSVNKGCETQLLAPCFGSPLDWTAADHDQHYDVSGGMQMNDKSGGWLSWNGEYGSGLSSTACLPANGNCKFTPHTIFSIQKGVALTPHAALTLGIDNIFNDRFLVTFANAQGDHYVAGRVLNAGLSFSVK